ncbi:MAG TPA: hypothetical protein VG965_05755 [Patescibacteria group bacterium]|nr:hypothetical protein [Patescibacteria group bacterium]
MNDEDVVAAEEEIETQSDTIETPEEMIQEGQVVGADIPDSTMTGSSSAMVLESLESLIRENLAKTDKLNIELNQQKEMLDSVLENDETYKLHSEAAKQAAKVKSSTKSEIIKRPEVAHVARKVQDISTEIKEIKDSMNSYLQEYQRLSGSNEIDDANGEPMQIISSVKLVKRRP